MACRLFGAKPLYEPMIEYYYLDHIEKYPWTLNQNTTIFIWKKHDLNMLLQNDDNLALMGSVMRSSNKSLHKPMMTLFNGTHNETQAMGHQMNWCWQYPMGPIETNFNEISINTWTFSSKKMC